MRRPTNRLRSSAARWRSDVGRLESVARAADNDPVTLEHSEVVSYTWQGAAIHRRLSESLARRLGVDYVPRAYVVWIADDAAPLDGQRYTIVSSADDTLDGRVGLVKFVHRDPIAAIRRLVVQLESRL